MEQFTVDKYNHVSMFSQTHTWPLYIYYCILYVYYCFTKQRSYVV